MPILTIQRQMRELGRIRTGQTVDAGSDGRGGRRTRPTKLQTFRLTSPSAELIRAAAALYGGEPVPWRDGEWEVVTDVAALDVVIPPGEPLSQWFELWTAGGCQRRCDGRTNVITMTPCACPAEVASRVELAKVGQACKATTRLNLMLPALPDLGVWMLESHGFYAAAELAGSAEILAMATSMGRLVPARLRLDQRRSQKAGGPAREFVVPVLELVSTRLADLPVAMGFAPSAPALTGPLERPALPATTLPATSDLRGPLVADEAEAEVLAPELTTEELVAGISALGVATQVAVNRAHELFGGRQLTAAERWTLLERLKADIAGRAR